MSPRQIYIMVLLCAAALCGCLGEAEHSNPLDPGAPGFDSVGTVGGTTTRLYPPHSPVPGAEVQLSPGGFASISDAEGRFSIRGVRSEEHTSELQSRENLVCRLLLEKKKKGDELALKV